MMQSESGKKDFNFGLKRFLSFVCVSRVFIWKLSTVSAVKKPPHLLALFDDEKVLFNQNFSLGKKSSKN